MDLVLNCWGFVLKHAPPVPSSFALCSDPPQNLYLFMSPFSLLFSLFLLNCNTWHPSSGYIHVTLTMLLVLNADQEGNQNITESLWRA